ncbi:MATE family efflux transporter [Desulfitibacter alkalitolerans]|uniref:MATE family efflux transporter n=1 Tax=Desulfitibacter alkalitolerans TaxID=264641 RepID=UPI0004819396|nr:MATE family efflux transporter [Desulfitibacter alkalitolerans]
MHEVRFIMKLALPAIFEMILHMMVGLVDIAMVGRLGADSLTAVGLGGQFIYTTIFLFAAVGIGAGAIIARAIGAQNFQEASRISGQALSLAALLGVIIGVFTWFLAPAIFNIFAPNEVVHTLGVEYLRILSLSSVFLLVLLIGESACRSAGYTKIPLKVAMIGNTINIVLNYVLIFGKLGFPALGVKGAAIGTLVSFTISCIIILFVLTSGRIPIKITRKHLFPIRWIDFKRIIKLTLPAGGEELVRAGSQITGVYLIIGLGSVPYAAHQVGISIESISFMPGYGFAIVAAALVGQSLGSKDPGRAHRLAFKTMYLAVATMTAAACVFFFFSEPLVRIFTTDESIIPLASAVVKIAAFAQTAIAIEMIMAGALRGAGDTRFPFYLSIIGNWFIRIPLFYAALRIYDLGLDAVWWITVFQWIVIAVLALWRFKLGRWKNIQV